MHYKAAWACGQAALRLAHMPTRRYDHHRLSPLVSTRNDEGPLKNAPVKKEIMVSGGENPTGNVCEALHWHGYIGMEREAVDLIAEWIKKPIN